MSIANINPNAGSEELNSAITSAVSSPSILSKVKTAVSSFFCAVPAVISSSFSSVKKMTASLISVCPSRKTVAKVGLTAIALGAAAYGANKYSPAIRGFIPKFYK